jgi:hypothetical protein
MFLISICFINGGKSVINNATLLIRPSKPPQATTKLENYSFTNDFFDGFYRVARFIVMSAA